MAKSNIHYWLAVHLIPRLSLRKKRQLVEQIGLTTLFEHSPALSVLPLTERQRLALLTPNWSEIDRIIADAQAAGAVIIGFDDARYPSQLKQIYDPPLVLFARGNTDLLQKTQLAIVGSRNCTINGREIAYQFAEKLASYDLVITSGLALGIDAFAHQGALASSGNTIAVTATGIDITYPARHRQLVNDIVVKGGLILSEFLPKTVAKKGHFPRRNRIISGLAQGVLVVEAKIKSGSLITAKMALEQNRDVFAVPGSICNEMASGCHALIKQGAKLVTEVADIMNELAIEFPEVNTKEDHASKKECEKTNDQGLLNDALLASVGDEITPIDVVVSRTQLPIEEVLSRLTVLELRGLVAAVPGGYLKLTRG
ncbi:DNA-protecting protein DprA [Thalassotalea sp. LPB0316]|uniref:DNA-processing protein DprA n=1 Tax=Thalassotalea sp. LPB0316 TaxID=2769490 RepID=UPI001867DC18|nr:DNA-processing protein DprA [Thalassotalea sp. LPB0316]QOL26408.1 DNA-protecting protein DprA [Thalassotalea sp. LPB0316]